MAISDVASLKQRIAYLDQKRQQEKAQIVNEFSVLSEKLKPANIIRSIFSSMRQSSELKDDLIHGAVGLGTGFLTNKVLLGSLNGPLKKILGLVIQAGITNAAVKYPETIKEKGLGLVAKFLKSIKFKEPEIDRQHESGSYTL